MNRYERIILIVLGACMGLFLLGMCAHSAETGWEPEIQIGEYL